MKSLKPKVLFLITLSSVVLITVMCGLYVERGSLGGASYLRQTWFDIYTNQIDQKRVKVDNKVDIAIRFEERARNITSVCKRYKEQLDILQQNLNNLRYLKDHNILYCPIEKIASTFWQKILYAVSNPEKHTDSFDVSPFAAYANSKYQRIQSNNSLSEISNSSVSFLFVRDPFTRLFSGWLDKFFSVNYYYWSFGRKIIRKIRRKPKGSSMRCGNDVSFNEFVYYITQEILIGGKVDKHFSPSVDHCNVCEVNFTYIGKYETLQEDAKFIVKAFRVGDRIDIEKNFEKKSVLDVIQDSAKFLFSQKDFIKHCLSFQCALFRVWKRLVCRGVIGKDIQFPYLTPEQAKTATLQSFTEELMKARDKSDPKQLANNRNEALTEAYMSLDNKTFDLVLQAYELDFDLFGYFRKPQFLQHLEHMTLPVNTSSVNFKYLQECPF